jgi:SAM-dependent methyltransferase
MRAQDQARVDSLGPWIHEFTIDGERFARNSLTGRSREQRCLPFFDVFPDAERILELGPLEGEDTVFLARHPGVRQVVALEGRPDNLERASLRIQMEGLTNVSLVLGDIEAIDLGSLGTFDAALCSSVLYHVTRPWNLLRRLLAATPRVLIWTHYWAAGDMEQTDQGYRVRDVAEEFPIEGMRGLSSHSTWFDRESLFRAISDAGWKSVETVDERCHQPVSEITVSARR